MCEKGTMEDEMVGWHHRLNGYEFEQALGDGEGQGVLACCQGSMGVSKSRTRLSDWTSSVLNKTPPCLSEGLFLHCPWHTGCLARLSPLEGRFLVGKGGAGPADPLVSFTVSNRTQIVWVLVLGNTTLFSIMGQRDCEVSRRERRELVHRAARGAWPAGLWTLRPPHLPLGFLGAFGLQIPQSLPPALVVNHS